MDRIKDVIRNWSRLVAGRAMGLALATASLCVLRGGPDLVAQSQFFWLLSIHALCSLVVLSGLGTALVPAMARSRATDMAANVTRVARRRGLAMSLVFVGVARSVAPEDPWLMASAIAIVGQSLLLGSAPSVARGDTRALTRVEVLGRALSLVAILALSAAGVGGAGPYLLAWTLPPVLAATRYARHMPRELRATLGIRQWFVRARAERPATTSDVVRWTSIGDLFRAAYLHGSPALLGALASSASMHEAFAHFGFAHRLFLIAALVPASLSTTIAGRFAVDAKLSPSALRTSLAWLAACAIPVIAGASLLAVLEPLHGEQASTDFAILMTAMPALFLSAAALPWLLANRCEMHVLVVSIAGLVTTAASLFALWPALGLHGGATAIVLGECVVALLAVRITTTQLGRRADRRVGGDQEVEHVT